MRWKRSSRRDWRPGGRVERALATVFLTVGLTVLLSLPLAGARPNIGNAELGPSAVAVGALVFAGLGIWLFARMGDAERKYAARLAVIVDFQKEARELRDEILQDPNTEMKPFEGKLQAWLNRVHEWFKAELPMHAEAVVRPSTRPPVLIYGSDPPGHKLVRKLNVYSDNLSGILFALTHKGSDE